MFEMMGEVSVVAECNTSKLTVEGKLCIHKNCDKC